LIFKFLCKEQIKIRLISLTKCFCFQEQIQCNNNIIYRRAQKLESVANNVASNKIVSSDKNYNATSSTPLDNLPIPKSIIYV